MNRIVRYTLFAVLLILLIHHSLPVEAEGPDEDLGYYYYYKLGTGRTVETALAWSSFTGGYYVTPSIEGAPVEGENKHLMLETSEFLSRLSQYTIGKELNLDRFSYGYEVSGAWVTDEKITDRIDLTAIGKVHYWTNSDHTTYIGLGGGYAYNELRDENRSDLELNVGGHVFFASELEVGTKINTFDRPVFLTLTWAHRSNGGIEEDNTGINSIYLSLARRY